MIDKADAEIRAMMLLHLRVVIPFLAMSTELLTGAECPAHSETHEREFHQKRATLLLHPPHPAVAVLFAVAVVVVVDAKDRLLEQGKPLDAAAAVALEPGTYFPDDVFRENIEITRDSAIE